MTRRRFLGHIDPHIHATEKIKTRIDDSKLEKIDVLADIPTNNLTQVGNLTFDGSIMKPNGLHITGSNNQFKLQGTDTTGTSKAFVVSVQGGVLRIDPI